MAGIYVHIPFCHSKCAYCDFFSTPAAGALAPAYIDALIREYRHRQGEISSPINTIYIGGGTPSSLDRALLDRLFAALPSTGIEEYTIEVNPEDVTPEFARWLTTETPLSRVSMGVQSLNNNILAAIGRRHTAEQAIAAAELLVATGKDVSLDLIYGLPGQDAADWRRSLDEVIALGADHLSCYLLSYEPGTRLTAMKNAGKINEVSDVEAIEMYEILISTAASAGFEHYEISNFARQGHQARHNSSYWNLTPYLGLGTGAHSFDGKVRRINPNNIRDYTACSGKDFAITEEENESERFNDFVITALRTSRGMSLTRCSQLFGEQRAAKVMSTAEPYVRCGSMWHRGDSIGIAENHWLTADSIMLSFIEV